MLSKHTLTLAIGILIAFSIAFKADDNKAKYWKIDKSHASVQFSIDHFFSSVPGKFKDFSGTINFDPKNLEGSKASFIIQVASIDTDEKERDQHLLSEDFFAAEKHPKIIFNSTEFEKVSEKEYKVKGKLTMRGTTNEIVLPLKITGRMDNPWKEGYEIMGVKIETTLDRTDYGIGTGNWAATSVVGDEVEIKISMELDSKK